MQRQGSVLNVLRGIPQTSTPKRMERNQTSNGVLGAESAYPSSFGKGEHLPSTPKNPKHRLPDVYVFSPEEDGEVAYSYCAFRASEPSSPNTPDLEKLAHALAILEKVTEKTPIFSRRNAGKSLEELVIMPKKRTVALQSAQHTGSRMGGDEPEVKSLEGAPDPPTPPIRPKSFVKTLQTRASALVKGLRRPKPQPLAPTIGYPVPMSNPALSHEILTPNTPSRAGSSRYDSHRSYNGLENEPSPSTWMKNTLPSGDSSTSRRNGSRRNRRRQLGTSISRLIHPLREKPSPNISGPKTRDFAPVVDVSWRSPIIDDSPYVIPRTYSQSLPDIRFDFLLEESCGPAPRDEDHLRPPQTRQTTLLTATHQPLSPSIWAKTISDDLRLFDSTVAAVELPTRLDQVPFYGIPTINSSNTPQQRRLRNKVQPPPQRLTGFLDLHAHGANSPLETLATDSMTTSHSNGSVVSSIKSGSQTPIEDIILLLERDFVITPSLQSSVRLDSLHFDEFRFDAMGFPGFNNRRVNGL